LLSPVLGVGVASTLFAVALLASGQNSTLTGTLAGQIVMEGFLNFRMRPWLRRLVTRLIAIVPAVTIIGMFGEGRTTELIVASQVILSLQLGFAVWPLMRFTSERAKMGAFVNGPVTRLVGWTVTLIIITLNLKLLFDMFAPAALQHAVYGLLTL
jgi:manganese transport protein